MIDDATFLAMIGADRDAMPVYADWLEERGESRRAAFVRLDHRLRGIAPRQRRVGALALAAELRALAEGLPVEWLAEVAHPRLVDTAWRGRDDDGFLVLRFLTGGILNYSQSSGTYQNGTWIQAGSALIMETNDHYADYEGVIVGDRIRGIAHNIVRKKWAWSVARSQDPEVTQIPDRVVTTVYGHHATAIRGHRATPRRPRRTRTPRK
jgi:uncharacterized protein (TIGR02996 family)